MRKEGNATRNLGGTCARILGYFGFPNAYDGRDKQRSFASLRMTNF